MRATTSLRARNSLQTRIPLVRVPDPSLSPSQTLQRRKRRWISLALLLNPKIVSVLFTPIKTQLSHELSYFFGGLQHVLLGALKFLLLLSHPFLKFLLFGLISTRWNEFLVLVMFQFFMGFFGLFNDLLLYLLHVGAHWARIKEHHFLELLLSEVLEWVFVESPSLGLFVASFKCLFGLLPDSFLTSQRNPSHLETFLHLFLPVHIHTLFYLFLLIFFALGWDSFWDIFLHDRFLDAIFISLSLPTHLQSL